MDFYERVKQLVKNKNFTLKFFIESLGINYDSYNGQKRYNNLPRADDALKIASALNTTVEYLVTGKNVAIPMDLEITIKQLEQFTYEERQPILFMLQGQIDYWKKVLQK